MRQARHEIAPVHRPDLHLRTGPVWIAVLFPALLGSLHLTHAVASMMAGRWAGYLSAVFGALLLLASAAVYFYRTEFAFLSAERLVRIRRGVGPMSAVREIPFDQVRAVRLTVDDGAKPRDATIELLCPLEDVACPPTAIPRQEALYLALMMDLPLMKVSSQSAEDSSDFTGHRQIDPVRTPTDR